DAAYSEDVGWRLLGRLLEAVTGEPLGSHLRATVLDPLGMTDTWIGMTPEEYEALLPRLGVSHDMRGLQSYPLLLERGGRMCTDVNPAHGGYSTADDLARFYAALLGQLDGGESPHLPRAETLATFTSSQRPPTEDLVLGRPCEYGLGFMTALDGHAFGRSPSPSAFGHSGNVGSSFAWADPEHDLAVGVLLNGVVDPDSAFLRRPALVRAVYADLEALEDDGDELEAVAPDEAPARGGWRRLLGR
ncbi:MAG: beta-lactamase family protein, partial [Acidimicrobiia bacterium]|nr:beta-lactamase family protein [Acidimicrobiia bacterium]